MGGIVAADVVLLRIEMQDFGHNILGTIHLDAPLLGIHPSVISAGLASLFKPKPKPDPSQQSEGSSSNMSLETLNLEDQKTDPNFNPRFSNDGNLPSSLRPIWSAAGHFLNKHAVYPDSKVIRRNISAISSAANAYVTSHVEFGGAVADQKRLWERYKRLRAMEERGSDHRARLAIFWTACTGNPKREKSPSLSGISTPTGSDVDSMPDDASLDTASIVSQSEIQPLEPAQSVDSQSSQFTSSSFSTAVASVDGTEHMLPDWPPLPPTPTLPSPPDFTQYTDKAVQEAIKRQHERNVKAFNQASKDREATIKERKKVEEKLQKVAEKESKKIRPQPNTSKPASFADDLPRDSEKPVKEKHFCVLPPNHSSGLDPIWMKVQMGSIDQVTAHCGLFDANRECYMPLIHEVAETILGWVQELRV
jgi:hypothetical protein